MVSWLVLVDFGIWPRTTSFHALLLLILFVFMLSNYRRSLQLSCQSICLLANLLVIYGYE